MMRHKETEIDTARYREVSDGERELQSKSFNCEYVYSLHCKGWREKERSERKTETETETERVRQRERERETERERERQRDRDRETESCLLYTSDAADE